MRISQKCISLCFQKFTDEEMMCLFTYFFIVIFTSDVWYIWTSAFLLDLHFTFIISRFLFFSLRVLYVNCSRILCFLLVLYACCRRSYCCCCSVVVVIIIVLCFFFFFVFFFFLLNILLYCWSFRSLNLLTMKPM